MDECKEPVSLNHDAIGLVIFFARMHHRTIEKCFSGLGLHNSQHRLLMYLAKSGRTPSQKEIARDMNISPASVAIMIKKMEKSGYIVKSGCDGDGRRNMISITPAGMDVVSKSRVYFEQVDQAVFEGIDSGETRVLCETLRKMMGNLMRYEERLNAGDSQTKE